MYPQTRPVPQSNNDCKTCGKQTDPAVIAYLKKFLESK